MGTLVDEKEAGAPRSVEEAIKLAFLALLERRAAAYDGE